MEYLTKELLKIITNYPNIKKKELPEHLQDGTLITKLRNQGNWIMSNNGYYITTSKTTWIDFCEEFKSRGIKKIEKATMWMPKNEKQLNIKEINNV